MSAGCHSKVSGRGKKQTHTPRTHLSTLTVSFFFSLSLTRTYGQLTSGISFFLSFSLPLLLFQQRTLQQKLTLTPLPKHIAQSQCIPKQNVPRLKASLLENKHSQLNQYANNVVSNAARRRIKHVMNRTCLPPQVALSHCHLFFILVPLLYELCFCVTGKNGLSLTGDRLRTKKQTQPNTHGHSQTHTDTT